MSGLRCKPGDLAVVVRSITIPENIGRFVIVERLADECEFSRISAGVIWRCHSAAGDKLPARLRDGSMVTLSSVYIFDGHLRPIRPNDGEDESLSWSKPLRREELA